MARPTPTAVEPPVPDALRRLLPPALLAQCRTHTAARGECLFRTGQRPAAMHHVHEGEVALQRTGEDGGTVVLQRVRHGFVAEASLEAARYHCDAVVLAPAGLTRVPLAPLRQALQTDAAFAQRWIAMLNAELRRLRRQCERLALPTVEARLLHLLRTEGDAQGLRIDGGLKSLAGELGITHEALYRCVARLEREGRLRRLGSPVRLQAM